MDAKTLAFLPLLGACLGAAGQESDPAKLAQQKNCLTCHAMDKKIVGPSYQEVAKKYAGQKDAAVTLVTKVMKGSSGTWGAVPMPPQSVSEAEAQQLVSWILKQK
jgi:cytochrome c